MGRLGWSIIAFWPLVAMGQAPSPSPAPAPNTVASLKAEAESARESFGEVIREIGKSGKKPFEFEATVRAAEKVRRVRLLSVMDRGLTLARLHPGESEGVAAATLVATEASFEGGDDFGERGDAAYRLLADAPKLDDLEIFQAVFVAQVVDLRYPEVARFLRSVLSRSRDPELVALARWELGHYLAEMARMHDRLAAPISGPELTKELTKVCLDRCRAIDGPKLRSEAEALLEEVIRQDDAGMRIRVGSKSLTLGEAAAGELYRIRHLRIGQPAPELVGEDIDGAPIRLSDFRGKVVVLSFWATSSAPYVRSIGGEKELVAAMQGRPFALVGVNGDAAEDRAKVKKAVTDQGMTWRSFWAGGPDGAIPRGWGVRRWPSVYTIDAHGTIRDDHASEKLTPAAFQSLVQAAEEAAQ